ncbi:hypothetical protein ACFY0Z_30105 [Streptomyces kronopolitis]|uniref:hypothetical protein n=1 Tax=Streptomyces kronopolitis TaxID=1612435 RepID=UPI0036CBEBD4
MSKDTPHVQAPTGPALSPAGVKPRQPLPGMQLLAHAPAESERFEVEHDPRRAWAGCWMFTPPPPGNRQPA